MSKVGKIVKVMHVSNRGGLVRLVKTKPVYMTISQEYVGNTVALEGTSDIWDVIPSKDPKAQFETYIPSLED